MLSSLIGLDTRDRPLAVLREERAGALLDERDPLRRAHLPRGREAAPILWRHPGSAHHALDAPAGVAAGERGGLTGPCLSAPPAPPGGIIARKVISKDREIEEAEVPSEEEQPLGPLAFQLRPIQRALHRR